MRLPRFAYFAWFVVAYTIAVILWGAFVRASGSGAGCGSHWPLCDGQIVPLNPSVERIVEFTHRSMSGLALVLVFGLIIFAFRAYPWGRVRYGALVSGGFMLIEALIGAALVLLALVGTNDSAARAVVVGLHLLNTFLLLAALTLTAWWASGGWRIRWRELNLQTAAVGAALLGVILVAVSGAVTALGDTLFPAGSLEEGLRQDVSPTAHFLIQLRVVHPILAIAVGTYLLILTFLLNGSERSTTRTLAFYLRVLVIAQLLAGAVNVALLAPTWMQLLHLLLADLVWILLVLYSASLLAVKAAPVRAATESPETRSVPVRESARNA
jgi:heme A synthase